MDSSWDIVVAILVLFGLLFFVVAVFALSWAAKHGQWENLEKGSRVIFDQEEPEGVVGDTFPGKKKKVRGRDAPSK